LAGCTPKRIIKRAISKGLDCIVITDARQDLFFDKLCKEPKKYIPGTDLVDCNGEIALLEKDGKFMYLLRGMEHHDDKGHLLDIGGNTKIEYNPGYSLKDRISKAHDNNRIIGAAHVCDTAFGGMGEENLEETRFEADFIEIFNSLTCLPYNQRALQLSEKYNIPGLANSDDHNAKPGTAYTILSVKKAESIEDVAENIKEAIRNGSIKGYCQKYVSFLEKLWIFAGKNMLRGDFKPLADRTKRFMQG
jgi:predicted metal-dependent phosphoesterase TrpH